MKSTNTSVYTESFVIFILEHFSCKWFETVQTILMTATNPYSVLLVSVNSSTLWAGLVGALTGPCPWLVVFPGDIFLTSHAIELGLSKVKGLIYSVKYTGTQFSDN